jgi:hypothetical protein
MAAMWLRKLVTWVVGSVFPQISDWCLSVILYVAFVSFEFSKLYTC